MTAVDLDAITREVQRVRHAHAEIQNHTRPGAVTGYLICVEQSADDVPWLCGRLTELVADVRKLREQLGKPCGSCHPCENWADETWRRANRKPPEVITWDDTREAMQRVARLANQMETAGDAETARLIRDAMHMPTLGELLDQADAAASAEPPTDRELLAAVHRWARTNGWRWHRGEKGWINNRVMAHATQIVIWDGNYHEVVIGRRREHPWGWHMDGYPAPSVRQAVDILAALGVLPVELSSAWRAGVAAR